MSAPEQPDAEQRAKAVRMAEEIRDERGPDRVLEIRRARMWEREPSSWTRYECHLSDALLAAEAEIAELRGRCPICTHEWRRHDPEDGKCDAGGGQLGECPCGRDPAYHRVRNAARSYAALSEPTEGE